MCARDGSTRELWGAAQDDIWLGANQGLAHWDGKSWTAVDIGEKSIHELLGFASDDVWGVAFFQDPAPHIRLARYDGLSWTTTPAADLDFGNVVDERSLTALSGAAPDELWLSGYEGAFSNDEAFIAMWDGAAFSMSLDGSNRPSTSYGASCRRRWV